MNKLLLVMLIALGLTAIFVGNKVNAVTDKMDRIAQTETVL